MSIIIRNEKSSDYRKTEEITREAFWNLYFPGCNEHLIVHNLRDSKDFIPELTFVIEKDDEIVGSIFYSHSKVVKKNGEEFKTISFGPVCILPKYHRQGLGRQLITHSIEKAKELGFSAILIGGYPHHYKPYGFEGSKKYNVSMADGNFYTGIMMLPLFDGALNGVSGIACFSEDIEIDEMQLDEFDKLFEDKEKMETQSQIDFAVAVCEVDTKVY